MKSTWGCVLGGALGGALALFGLIVYACAEDLVKLCRREGLI